MTDDLDLNLTPAQIFQRGERRINRIETGSIADEFTSLRNSLALAVAERDRAIEARILLGDEINRLSRIIKAQDFLLNLSIPRHADLEESESENVKQ